MKMKRIISIGLFAVLAVFFAYYIANNISDFNVLLDINLKYIPVILILYTSVLITNGIFLQVLIREFGIKLKFFEYSFISTAVTFGNIFLPLRGGTGFRAYYLNKKYDLSYSAFLASLGGNYVVIFAVNSFAALACLGIYMTQGVFDITVTFILGSIFLLCMYAVFFPPRKTRFIPIKFVRDYVEKIITGWYAIRRSLKNVLILLLLSVIQLLLIAGMMYFEFRALGMGSEQGDPISFLQNLFLASINSFSLLISITPASLGIREGLLMLVSHIVNVRPADMLAVSLLDRVLTFSLLLLLSVPAFLYLKKGFS